MASCNDKTSSRADTDTPKWQLISQKKQKARTQALHQPPSISITVPSNLIPYDTYPPDPKSGPQPVIHIPDQLLFPQDRTITSLLVEDLLAAIRTQQYTSTQVCSAFCRRASIAHQLTNCLTEPLFERALKRAATLDSRLMQDGKPVGPLHGLPVSVKDTFNITGVDSSVGIASLCFKPAESNAPLVELLESLGCVVIAKTNVPQAVASMDSVNNVWGRTMNPFNRLLTAGGSSGGEGVLVAMGGCAIGFGTDIGGSIRIPAMCNGVYGFKPSVGRLPYGGQRLSQLPGLDGMSRASVQAVAGPIARSMQDIEVVMREVVPRTSLYGEDCLPWSAATRWMGSSLALDSGTARHKFVGSGPKGEFVVGVLRSDGNCQLLPPVAQVMDEVSSALRAQGSKLNVKVVDLPTPKAWTKAQSVMGKLMSVDGDAVTSKLILETDEPLVPWMSTRFKHGGKAQKLERVAEIQALRSQLEREMLRDVWGVSVNQSGQNVRGIDAIICPMAAHPVPAIEAYNAVGYTSSWVLFDYPAGSVPIRAINEQDLERGKPLNAKLKILGSWDERNRQLWDESKTDRNVYLGSTLSVQCVTARLEDEKLAYVMGLVDLAVKQHEAATKKEAKL